MTSARDWLIAGARARRPRWRNELFDRQVPAIERHGGEVLKFIGDGLLAIFTPGEDGMRGCRARALAASRDATASMQTRSGIRFGIALHVGEVGYANIGSEDRLDFTRIGRPRRAPRGADRSDRP